MHKWVWNGYPYLEQEHICLCVSKYSLTAIWIIYQKESTASLISIICILHNSLFVPSSHCSDNTFKVFHCVLNLRYLGKARHIPVGYFPSHIAQLFKYYCHLATRLCLPKQ